MSANPYVIFGNPRDRRIDFVADLQEQATTAAETVSALRVLPSVQARLGVALAWELKRQRTTMRLRRVNALIGFGYAADRQKVCAPWDGRIADPWPLDETDHGG